MGPIWSNYVFEDGKEELRRKIVNRRKTVHEPLDGDTNGGQFINGLSKLIKASHQLFSGCRIVAYLPHGNYTVQK